MDPKQYFWVEDFCGAQYCAIQVETERDVYSSSTLIGVSACTCFFCCSVCWPASTMPTATLGLGT